MMGFVVESYAWKDKKQCEKKRKTPAFLAQSAQESFCDSSLFIVCLPSFKHHQSTCVHCRGHVLCPVCMKLDQNVCFENISDKSKIGTCQVKNFAPN